MNVRSKVAPGGSSPELNEPSSAVTECSLAPLLRQVMVVRAGTSSSAGLKPQVLASLDGSVIVTVRSVGFGVIFGPVMLRVPFITSGWIEQWYATVPGSRKRRENRWVGCTSPESNEPSSATTRCVPSATG